MTALLISHDGARWLPAVLEGVGEQSRRPDRLVAVDTGAVPETEAVWADRRDWQRLELAPTTSYAEAVRAGLDSLGEVEGDPAQQWVWLLHDDSRPERHALRRLLTAARQHPEVAILGPKLREWPSLRRLLELGVTISATGRRETGLERGEYDQGQHDQRREVLAVNTAGMLVRRDVLDQLGFDPDLPLHGNDIDFGWRAARAGHRTLVVPEAVAFHAEAAARGQRRGRLAARHHRQARAAAIHTLLVNGEGRWVPLQAVRLLLGSMLRALGLLLGRAPGLALDEAVAPLSVLARPGRIARGRRRRREHHVVEASAVRHLLPPWWLPYRHGLDALGDFLSALLSIGRDTAARGSVSATALLEDEDQPGRDAPGLPSLLVRNPLVWLIVGSLGLALVAGRGQLVGDDLTGGALLRAPEAAAEWWRAHLAAGHLVGTGTSVAAAPYLLPLALAGVLLLGSAQAVVSALVLLVVPLATLSALRFLRRVTTGRVAAMFGAVGYGLLPVVSGAAAHGRLGTLVAAVLLPWVATAALRLDSADPDRRWRAGWRTGLGVALLSAFVPSAWLLAVAMVIVALGVGLVREPSRWRAPDRWGPLVAAVVSTPLLLLPWALSLDGLGPLLVEAGRADAAYGVPGALDLLAGRTGDPGAPLWLGLLLLAAAVAAVLRPDTRYAVRGAWTVAVAAAGLLLLLRLAPVDLAGLASVTRAHPGFAVLLLHAALLTAVVLAADGLWRTVSAGSFSWRQPVAGLAAVAGLVGVVGGAVWWVAGGLRPPVSRDQVAVVPDYMTELAAGSDTEAVLMLRGGPRDGVAYTLLRRGTPVIGEDALAARTPPDPRLTRAVADLVAGSGEAAVERLGAYGVGYVVAPRPVSPAVQGALDSATTLSRASEGRPGDSAWRVQAPRDLSAVTRPEQSMHTLLLGLQGVAIVTVIVLAAPTRRQERR